MEDILLFVKEMMEEKLENSLLGIKSERMDDDNMIEDIFFEFGVIKQDDVIFDFVLDIFGILEEEIIEKENEVKEKNVVMFDLVLNIFDNVEEDMIEREEKEEGELVLVKEIVFKLLEDNVFMEIKEDLFFFILVEN